MSEQAWPSGSDLRFDDRGRLLDADGRLSAVHEPVTYLPDRQWTELRGTGVEVYHAGGCPCSREQVWVRHRSSKIPPITDAERELADFYAGLYEVLGIDGSEVVTLYDALAVIRAAVGERGYRDGFRDGVQHAEVHAVVTARMGSTTSATAASMMAELQGWLVRRQSKCSDTGSADSLHAVYGDVLDELDRIVRGGRPAPMVVHGSISLERDDGDGELHATCKCGVKATFIDEPDGRSARAAAQEWWQQHQREATDEEDQFGTTCTECLVPLDNAHPYGTNADGDFVHYACADDSPTPDPVILQHPAGYTLAEQVRAVWDEEGVDGIADAIRRVARGEGA